VVGGANICSMTSATPAPALVLQLMRRPCPAPGTHRATTAPIASTAEAYQSRVIGNSTTRRCAWHLTTHPTAATAGRYPPPTAHLGRAGDTAVAPMRS